MSTREEVEDEAIFAVMCMGGIVQRWMASLQHAERVEPADLRRYADELRNKLQVIEASAAAIEKGLS